MTIYGSKTRWKCAPVDKIKSWRVKSALRISIRPIVSELFAIVHIFGHVWVPGHSIAVGMEIFDQKKPSTCQAGSKEPSFVYIRSAVRTWCHHKAKNLYSFIYTYRDSDSDYIQVLGNADTLLLSQVLFRNEPVLLCIGRAFSYLNFRPKVDHPTVPTPV